MGWDCGQAGPNRFPEQTQIHLGGQGRWEGKAYI